MNKTNFKFIETKEYKKFEEFCDSCAKYKYMGICHGVPGVGKTAAARYYSKWDVVEPAVKKNGHLFNRLEDPVSTDILEVGTLFMTAPTTRPQLLNTQLLSYAQNIRWAQYALFSQLNELSRDEQDILFNGVINENIYAGVDLIIIDEVDRLKNHTIELLRDIYDQNDMGMIFIGMPGIEKRLSRYPQLYSRVGFSHEYKKLSNSELKHILEYKWHELGLTISYADYENHDAVTNILKLSNGNFRLIQRLFAQIERIMVINNMTKISTEVVRAARDSLVIGNKD